MDGNVLTISTFISQDIAQKLGVSRSTIENWIRDEVFPSPIRLYGSQGHRTIGDLRRSTVGVMRGSAKRS
jgi:hypothetical protein